ncbi:MotE family protein [Paenibacillus sp. CAU 1782]
MADTNEETQKYNGFERFMFLMIPVLVVVVLLGVMLYVMDNDFRNRTLEIGQNIPVLKNVLPKPESMGSTTTDDATVRSVKLNEKIDELETELLTLKSELAAANQSKEAQEESIKDLQDENAQLKLANEESLLEDEQYTSKIAELASMFTKMTPSKAAPIIQNMTVDEMVLLFSSMRADDRVRILEKMDARVAAEATVKMKDAVKAKDLQIAALQSRLDEATQPTETIVSSTLDQDQLSATFGAMNAASAGELLIKMIEVSPSKVMRILNSVSDTARSSILSEMSKIDQAATANMMSRLMSGS